MNESVPGKILEEYSVRRNRLGLVAFGDTRRPVFLDLVPEARVGDYVRVLVGFATEKVAEAEARQAYEQLVPKTVEAALLAKETRPAAARRIKPR